MPLNSELSEPSIERLTGPPSAEGEDIASIIGRRAIHMVYQPIVDLESGQVVAFEALARGPHGTAFESPDVLFAAASSSGLTTQLDLVCRATAVSRAAQATNRRDFVLFVNGEPGHMPADEELAPFVGRPGADARTVLELAEREIFANPRDLLISVASARGRGWGIAIDDVGTCIDSLALIPLIDPDIIKLDRSMIQESPGRSAGLTLNAVERQVEVTGATVLAEGIETDEHAERARSMGAALGQGWLFGRPGPLVETTVCGSWPGRVWKPTTQERDRLDSSFDLVADHPRLRRSTKEMLLALSLDLEAQADAQRDGVVVFGCFQRDRHLTAATRERYEALARHGSLIAALGSGVTEDPAPGVRGVPLADDDPLVDEWTVAVISSHFAGALIARDVGDDGPDHLRRFDYLVTHDRALVRQVADILLRRVLPAEPTSGRPAIG